MHRKRSIDLDRSGARRLRIVVTQYDETKQNYKPSLGQAIKFHVGDLSEQCKMFDALAAWMKDKPWRDEAGK
jgi:hypothetical protein